MPHLGGAGTLSTHLEAATDPIVSVTAFRDPAADEFAEQALERTAHLGMIGGCRGKGAAVAVDEVTPIFLLHLA
jgi:hypothetical protein